MNKKVFGVSVVFLILLFMILMVNNEVEEDNNIDKDGKQIQKSQKIVVIDGVMYRNYNLTQKSWIEAKRYCHNLDLNGSGWRLPSIREIDKMANIKMYGKQEDFPKDWWSNNYPKNAVHYRGGAYFLKKPFLEVFSQATEKYHIFKPYVWTKEDIATNVDHYVNDFAYATNISGYGAELMLKKDRLLTMCVKDKF